MLELTIAREDSTAITSSFCRTDRVVCHCLQVRESQVRECVAVLEADTVHEVKALCGAGGGCTCCHARIRQLIAAERRVEFAPVACGR